MLRACSALVLGLILVGCDGSDADTDHTDEHDTDIPDTDTDTTPAYEGEGVPWASKTGSERQAYMGAVVVPTVTPLFQGLDPVAFASVTCDTCHQDAGSGNFAMPNPNLPQFSYTDWPSRTDADPHIASYTAFMEDELVPTMAQLLEMDPFDPVSGTGFGCLGCHTAM